MKASLHHNPKVEPWRALIEQTFTAYENGLTLVVVPSLLTVIDGAVASSYGDNWWSSTKTTKLATELRERALPQSITLAVAVSVEEFIKVVFAVAEFTASRPPIINRHWIQHGRDAGTWTRVDCLRLFQAIEAFLTM